MTNDFFCHDTHVAYDTCIKNGTLIPIREATMPVTQIEFAYGFGVYENIRIVQNKALFLEDHLARLEKSAAVIGLLHTFERKALAEWVQSLIRACASDAFNLKILLIGGRKKEDATLFILPLAPLFPDRKLWRDGARAVTVRYERSFPDAKTLSMLGSYVAYRQAKEKEAYDALLVDHDGNITEGTRTNFFVLRDKTIIGAPREKILLGVTMQHVLAVAKTHGYSYEEKPLHWPGEPHAFDGAFLTSTSSKIMPLRSIDETELVIPESLKELMKHFENFLSEEEK